MARIQAASPLTSDAAPPPARQPSAPPPSCPRPRGPVGRDDRHGPPTSVSRALGQPKCTIGSAWQPEHAHASTAAGAGARRRRAPDPLAVARGAQDAGRPSGRAPREIYNRTVASRNATSSAFDILQAPRELVARRAGERLKSCCIIGARGGPRQNLCRPIRRDAALIAQSASDETVAAPGIAAAWRDRIARRRPACEEPIRASLRCVRPQLQNNFAG